MSDTGGSDYLWRFGLEFDTSGLDGLLSSIESFAQRAQGGFGGAVTVPEGIGGAGNEIPLSNPNEFASGFDANVASLIGQLRELSKAGDISGSEFNSAVTRLQSVVQNLRAAATQFAAAHPAGTILGPNGQPLVTPAVAQARANANAANAVVASPTGAAGKDPIDKLYPQLQRVKDSQFILDPANRARLQDALDARAAQNVRDREIKNRDNITTLQARQGDQAVALQNEEILERRRLNAVLEKDRLAREGVARAAGGSDDIRKTEVGNRLDRERLNRDDELRYLQGRQDFRAGAGGNLVTDQSEEAGVRLARERDATAVGLERARQQTHDDIEATAQLARLKRLEALEINATINDKDFSARAAGKPNLIDEEARGRGDQRLRKLAIDEEYLKVTGTLIQAEAEGAAAQKRRATIIQAQTTRELATDEVYLRASGRLAAEQELQAGAVATRKEAYLLKPDTDNPGNTLGDSLAEGRAQAGQFQKRREAQTNAILQESLAYDRDYIDSRAYAAASQKSRTAKEQQLTQELLGTDREYIVATASASNSRRQLSAAIEAEARRERETGSFNFTQVEAANQIAAQREKAALSAEKAKQIAADPFAQIALVTDTASGKAGKQILDAQIKAQLQETLVDSQQYKDATAKAAANKRILASEIESATIDEVQARYARKGQVAAVELASVAVKKQAFDEEIKLQILQEQIDVERQNLAAGKTSLTAQKLVAQKQLQVLQREGAQQAFSQAGFDQSGSRFQRAQALIDLRRNGNVRDPNEYQTLGSFFGQRALNTFGYLTSGIAFYALFDQLKQAVAEATNAQRALSVLKATLESTDHAGDFTQTKQSLLDIATETGRLGSETVNVFRQLYGALGQDVPAALKATSQSLKFAEVTGLDPKEITDSLTALSLSFGQTDFTPFLDKAVHLEGTFGVLASETVKFAADLAPLANQLGFTSQQLEGLGAATQAVSGRSGGALAENFSRIFEAFTDPSKISGILQVYQLVPELQGSFNSLAASIGEGNVEKSFEIILKDLDNLEKSGAVEKAKSIKDQLVNVAGGPRQAGALAAALARPGITLAGIQGTDGDAAGALDKRFDQVRESLQETFKRIQRGFEELLQALLTSGVADVLHDLGVAVEALTHVASLFLQVFEDINDAMGGFPGRVLVAVTAVKAMSAALTALQETGLLRAFLGIGASSAAAPLPGLIGGVPQVAAAGLSTPLSAGPATAVEAGFLARLGLGAKATLGRFAPYALGAGAGFGISGLAGLAGQSAGSNTLGTAVGGLGAIGGVGALYAAAPFLDAVAPAAIPVAAAVATYKAIQTYSDYRSSLGDQSDQLRQQFQTVSPDELRSISKGGSSVGGDNLTRFADFTFGVEPIPDTASDVYKQRFGKSVGGALAPILARESGGAFTLGNNRGQSANFDPTDSDFIEKRLADIARQYSPQGATPNDTKYKAFTDEVNTARHNAEQTVLSAENEAKQAQFLQDQLGSGALDSTIETAIGRLKAHTGSPQEVRAAADRKLVALKATLANAGSNATLRDQIEQEIAKTDEQANAAIGSYYKDLQQRRLKILSIASGKADDPTAQIASDKELLKRPEIQGTEREDLLLDVLSNQRQAYQDYVDAATTAQEKLARINQASRFAFDPDIRKEVLKLQVTNDPQTKAAYQGIADTVGISIETLTDTVINAMILFGQESNQALIDVIEGKKRIIQEAIDQATKDHPELAPYAQYYGGLTLSELNNQEESLKAGGISSLADTGAAPQVTPQQRQQTEDAAAKERLQEQQAYLDLNTAQSKGDPVVTARNNVEKANLAVANAKPGAEYAQALVEQQNALNELEKAYDDIGLSVLDLASAQAEGNPLQQAQIALQKADLAVQQAVGEAAKNRALAERISAERKIGDVIESITESQISLLEAISRDSGDVVGAAQHALERAQQKLVDVQTRSPGDLEGINNARIGVVDAQRGVADAILKQREDDIQFSLDMKKITKGQAIALLQQLLTIPTNTLEQQREIQRQIEQLKGQLGQDFKFNLPTNLLLPTSYEARRVVQGGGGSNYDQRQINITINTASTDPATVATLVSEAVGNPRSNGTYAKRYG